MKKDELSIEQLGQEYENHIALQNFFIDKCKSQIKEAEKLGDLCAVKELRSNLNKFREIKHELEEISLHLKKYYKGEN